MEIKETTTKVCYYKNKIIIKGIRTLFVRVFFTWYTDNRRVNKINIEHLLRLFFALSKFMVCVQCFFFFTILTKIIKSETKVYQMS